MNTSTADAAIQAGRPTEPKAPGPKALGRGLIRSWRFVTTLLATGFFAEAALAGAMLSGVAWAQRAHRATAGILIAFTLLAGLVALLALRRVPHGVRLGLILLALAVASVLQAALGVMIGKGANLAWVHVPLGVALVAVAAQTVAAARRLGTP